ncbi:MAG: TonB-dependent receptor [Phascolarctobacterium sp.]|nr:TonB-dependent receptor [Phascolarctobacterium sp.]
MKKFKKTKLALLTACVCSSIISTAFAEEVHTDKEFLLDDIVVTATKTRMDAKEVPVAVEVIDQAQIKNLGAYSVQDALRLAANVDVQDNGMTGNQVQLRGNSTMHTLILIDGKRMAQENTQSSQNAYELKRVNISDVERIEVIRGNGSALYGSDALGGVINIITKTPDKPKVTIDVHTGTKDAATNFLYTSGKQGKFSMKLGGGLEKIRRIDSGKYNNYTVSGNSVTKVTEASSTNMFGTRRFLNTEFKYDFDDNHNLDFGMNFMREELKSYSTNSMGSDYTNKGSMATFLAANAARGAATKALANMGITTDNPMYQTRYNALYNQMYPVMLTQMQNTYGDMAMPQTYPMIQSHFYNNTRSDYSLSFNGKDGKHDYNIRAYLSELRKENTSHYTNLNTNANKMVDFDQNNYKQLVIEGKDTYSMDKNNVLTWGAEYKKDIMNGTHIKDAGTDKKTLSVNGMDKPSSEVSSETAAVYLQDELRIGDKLILIPAIRIDHHNAFGTHTSPKIGATYKFSENTRLKANWGKGFRAPTVYELYSQMEKVGMAPMPVNVIGNPDLEPEKSTNFDVSVEAERGKIYTKASYYHNKIKNMIDGGDYDPVKLAQNIIWSQYVNRDEVKLTGSELEIGYNFNKNWTARFNYNYLDAKDETTGNRLSYRARHNGLVMLTYTDAKPDPLTVSLYSKFYIDYHQNNTYTTYTDTAGKTYKYQNDYTFNTVGLLVNKQFSNHLRVYGGVENIFNKKFTYDTFHSYSIDGRTWRIGAEWTF